MNKLNQYRGVQYELNYRSDLFSFVLDFKGHSLFLNASSDDQALIESKAIINQHLLTNNV